MCPFHESPEPWGLPGASCRVCPAGRGAPPGGRGPSSSCRLGRQSPGTSTACVHGRRQTFLWGGLPGGRPVARGRALPVTKYQRNATETSPPRGEGGFRHRDDGRRGHPWAGLQMAVATMEHGVRGPRGMTASTALRPSRPESGGRAVPGCPLSSLRVSRGGRETVPSQGSRPQDRGTSQRCPVRTPCACMGVGALASSVRAPDGSVRAAQPPARGARPFRKPPRRASRIPRSRICSLMKCSGHREGQR